MSDSGAIRAGRAFVEIFSDDVKLRAGLKRSGAVLKAWGSSVSSIGRSLLGLGAAAVTPLLAAAGVFAETGAELARGAQRTGIAVEELSRLKYAAEQSGVSFEQLETGVKKMERTVASAAGGNRQAGQALQQLGLRAGELAKLSPDRQFERIADAVSRVPNPTQRAALAMQIFGRSGADLLPLLDQGAGGIEAMKRRADALGLTMSGKDAEAALAFSRRLSDLWAVVRMGVFQVGGALAPVLTAAIGTFARGSAAVREFVKNHQGLAIGVLVGAAAIATAGAGLVLFGTGLSVVGSVLSGVAGGIGVVGTLVGAVLSPLGLLVLGIAAGSAALVRFTDVGQKSLTYVAKLFGGVKSDAVSALGGIQDALVAGDWGTAAAIAATFIKLEFAKSAASVLGAWDKTRSGLLDLWTNTAAGVATAWSYVVEYLSSWDGIKAAASKFMTWLSSSWSRVIDFIADRWAEQKVKFDAEQSVRGKYEGKTLDAGDADRLAQSEITVKRRDILERAEDKVRAEHPEYSSGRANEEAAREAAPDVEKMIGETRARYRRQFAGRQLSDGELQQMIDNEVQARVAGLHEMQGKQHRADEDRYRDRQGAIDKDFESKQPEAVRRAEETRRRIEAERQKRLAANAAELQKALAEDADPGKIGALKREMERLKRQAAAAAKSATEGVAKPKFDVGDASAGLGEAMKATASGTFNAQGAFGLAGAGDHLRRTAAATEKTSATLTAIAGILSPLAAGVRAGAAVAGNYR